MALAFPVKFFTNGCGVASTALLQNSRFSVRLLGGSRTLFTLEAIGVDGYEKQRTRVNQQFSGMADKFRAKMLEFTVGDSKSMIFTEDLKNMVHLIESTPDDLSLVHQMMKRFNQQNRHLRFGNFVFGPVVMRMYHHLNEPQQALAVFKDPELEGFFDQFASSQILCDLLHRNGLYQEVLDVYEMIKSKQVQGTKFPRNVVLLVMAACFRMNTVQSYEYALKMMQEMKQVGSEPVRRTITYAAATALNQNAPQIALEILSNCNQANYVTVRNLKLWSLADLNRPDDALPILRYSLEYDNPNEDKRSTVCPDVMEKIAASVQRLENKEVATEFERIRKALSETKQISRENLTELLDADIDRPPRMAGQGFERQNMERSFRIGQSIDLRPRRNPIYERERQTLHHD